MIKKSKELKDIEQFAKEYKNDLGPYGIRLRVEVDSDWEGEDERYRILVNDGIFSNELTVEGVQYDIIGLAATFDIFKNLPAKHYEKIIRDRETARIQKALASWGDKSYEFLPSDFMDQEHEFELCPCIKCYVDEIHISDTGVHHFYVHKVTLDENNNVKLVGRIAYPDIDTTDELYTYLGSVDAFDLEEIEVPEFDGIEV